MTTHEYIKQSFSSLGIQLSEAELIDMYENEEFTQENKREVQIALVRYIPTLLLKPNVSESGFSLSWDKNAVKDYYTLKCKELGIPNVLKPKVRFL